MNVPWGNGRFERVLVYGLGLSGRAAARFLRDRGIAVVAVDRRTAEEIGPPVEAFLRDSGIELRLGREPDVLPAGLDAIVLSPGVPPDQPLLAQARAARLPVIAEVELAFPFLQGPVLAITGSNGKSTTTALAGALLRAAGVPTEVCGNIGTPLCGVVEGPPGRVFVVELSSFQLEATDTFRPAAAALLNLSPDHLDRYPDVGRYAAAKRRIFARQETGDIAVLNADDPEVAATEIRTARRRLFSLHEKVSDGCHLEGNAVIETGDVVGGAELFQVGDLALSGLHNLENAMAAALLARSAGVAPSELPAGLRAFRGLPHRLERVCEWRSVQWFDDSKGTNVGATAKSVAGFTDHTVHLILGGRNKGSDFRELRPIVGRKASRVYLIGEAAEELERSLDGIVPAERADTLDRAVRLAAANARAGEVVVLSPACASFDQFRDFNHRGCDFQRLVRELQSGGAD